MLTGVSGAVFWLVLAVAMFIVEGLTVQLLCVWFAGGALIAMIASLMGAGLPLQLLIFFLTSIAVLVLGRPVLKKRLIVKKVATNADAVIDTKGVVIEEIDNIKETGRVIANGLDWSARSAGGEIIGVKQTVMVKAIEGVKLIVEIVNDSSVE